MPWTAQMLRINLLQKLQSEVEKSKLHKRQRIISKFKTGRNSLTYLSQLWVFEKRVVRGKLEQRGAVM